MLEMEESIQNTERRISMLNDFIALSLRKNNVCKELEQLRSESIKVNNLLTQAHHLMQEELTNLKHEYEQVMSQMRKKQMMVMDCIIKEKQGKIKDVKQGEDNLKLLLSCGKSKADLNNIEHESTWNQLGFNLAKLTINRTGFVTPKIKIRDYKASPLVKKNVNHIPFQFEEFDVTITQQQFDTIPKYMCGRETLQNLNTFLETAIIPCFNEKYKLIHKERSSIKNTNDIELWKLYNEQASYLPGRRFITPGDLTRKINKMLDKKSQNRLVMLRHIGIVSQMRVKQTVCYVWSYSGNQ